MAKIRAVRRILIQDLRIGRGQVRVRRVDEELDDLVDSIRLHGLLEPIVVCDLREEPGRYEVLMGQRRVLAHERLRMDEILAVIIDEPVDHETAQALSLTENLIRRDLDSRDIIDACTTLYRRYGSARAVAEETGIPYAQVLRHIKYDRLEKPLRERVDSGEVKLDVALKAQDTLAKADGRVDAGEATDLAEALSTLTGTERRQILEAKMRSPQMPVKSLMASFWAGSDNNRQIVVTIPARIHGALQARARQLGVTQDQAAAQIITVGLSDSPQPS